MKESHKNMLEKKDSEYYLEIQTIENNFKQSFLDFAKTLRTEIV